MALVVNLSRRRAVEQILGVVPRSIGYLQGGYKDSVICMTTHKANATVR